MRRYHPTSGWRTLPRIPVCIVTFCVGYVHRIHIGRCARKSNYNYCISTMQKGESILHLRSITHCSARTPCSRWSGDTGWCWATLRCCDTGNSRKWSEFCSHFVRRRMVCTASTQHSLTLSWKRNGTVIFELLLIDSLRGRCGVVQFTAKKIHFFDSRFLCMCALALELYSVRSKILFIVFAVDGSTDTHVSFCCRCCCLFVSYDLRVHTPPPNISSVR